MSLYSIAEHYNQKYTFNILPLFNKAPLCKWVAWQEKKMELKDLASFNWSSANGFGAVCGIDKLRCIDFDSVTDFAIVKNFLCKLGLPSDYQWTVISGSGKGYHIWFYADDDSGLFKTLGGEKSYYKLEPKPLPASLLKI